MIAARRALLAACVAIACSALVARPRLVASESIAVTAVHTVGMTVRDMDQSLAFYTTVLPFELVSVLLLGALIGAIVVARKE